MKGLWSRAAVVVLACLLAREANGQGAVTELPRQYYSDNWEQSPGGRFYFLRYYYRPAATDIEFQMHYVVWYPGEKDYYYYYNPSKQKYWCRALSQSRPSMNIWQVLDDPELSGQLADIAEQTWDTKQRKRPPIPNSTDGTLMDPPPVLRLNDGQ